MTDYNTQALNEYEHQEYMKDRAHSALLPMIKSKAEELAGIELTDISSDSTYEALIDASEEWAELFNLYADEKNKDLIFEKYKALVEKVMPDLIRANQEMADEIIWNQFAE